MFSISSSTGLNSKGPQTAASRWRRLRPAAWSLVMATAACGGWMWFTATDDDSAAPANQGGAVVASLGSEAGQIDGSNMTRAVGNIVMASAVSSDDGTSAAAEPDSDGQPQTLILGKWEDGYRGKRYLTVNEDGTGKMLVEPEGSGRSCL